MQMNFFLRKSKEIINYRYEKKEMNEATVKTVVVYELIKLLGYPLDPIKMEKRMNELTAKSLKRSDMVLELSDEDEVVIEVKKLGDSLNKHCQQISDYCKLSSKPKCSILTNGILFEIYSIDKNRKMSTEPIYTLNLLNLDNSAMRVLSLLSYKSLNYNINLALSNIQKEGICVAETYNDSNTNNIKIPKIDFLIHNKLLHSGDILSVYKIKDSKAVVVKDNLLFYKNKFTYNFTTI